MEKYKPDDIPDDIKKYIRMCESAKEKEYLNPNYWLFPGDWFCHQGIGINVVEKRSGDNISIPTSVE